VDRRWVFLPGIVHLVNVVGIGSAQEPVVGGGVDTGGSLEGVEPRAWEGPAKSSEHVGMI
jgi:hypothetical protein